jgi:hypothetical protein
MALVIFCQVFLDPRAWLIVLVLVVVLVLDFQDVLGLRCRNNPELQSKVLQACCVKRPFEDEDDDEDEDD